MIECPKCRHKHTPPGTHEDESGEWTCEECGFRFLVEIEYEPEYYTTCVTHEFGEFETVVTPIVSANWRFCQHCGKCEIREQVA